MDRPTVICHMLMSLDGKIDGPFFSAPETMPALRKYGEVRKDCWFQHLAIEVPGEDGKTEWCEAVTDNAYCKLP